MMRDFSGLRLFSFLSLWSHAVVQGSSTWISDDRVQDLNSSPILGRGYSIRTNSYRSNCLIVGGTSTPSFNYDYQFVSISPDDDNLDNDLPEQSELAKLYYRIKSRNKKAQNLLSNDEDDEPSKKEYNLIASMRIDRYYSSIKENEAKFSTDALALLENEDYVEFFKSCGVGFVRSIRRVQEVLVNFSFTSADPKAAHEFTQSIERYSSGQKYETAFSSSEGNEMKSLIVRVQAKGIGLAPSKEIPLSLEDDNESTLVLTDLSKFNSLMKFAYKRMTRNEGDKSDQTGQVHSIEVVPWTTNPSFQIASRVYDHAIYSSIPYNEIPSISASGVCKSEEHTPDSYKKCCNDDDKVEITRHGEGVSYSYCNPKRLLPTPIMRNNMEQNGEFVTVMNAANRKNFELQDRLQQCVNDLHQIDPSHDYKYLKSSSSRNFDNVEDLITVKELKMFLDPTADSALHRLISWEFSEHRGIFYDQCLESLYIDEDGDGTEKGSQYFMAEPYYEHKECAFPTCAYAGMRWNRDSEDGGCVRSTIKNGPLYQPKRTHYDEDSGAPPNCLLVFDPSEPDGTRCKYDQGELYDMQETFQQCWDHLPGKSNVSPLYLMERFCGLELEGSEADDNMKKQIDTMSWACPGWSDNLSLFVENLISCLIPVDINPSGMANVAKQFEKVTSLAAKNKKRKGTPAEFIQAGFDHESMKNEKRLFRLVPGTVPYERAKGLMASLTRSDWDSFNLSLSQQTKLAERAGMDILLKACKDSFDGKTNWNIVKELVTTTPKVTLTTMLTKQDVDSGAVCLHYVTKSKDLELFQKVYEGYTLALDAYDKQDQSVFDYAHKFSGDYIKKWVEDNFLQNVALGKTATQSSIIDDDDSYFGEKYECVAALAVDGDEVGRHDDPCSVSHTGLEMNPWWEVDLVSSSDIKKIRVYNRADTDLDMLKNFKVSVLQKSRGKSTLVWESEVQVVEPRPVTTFTLPQSTFGNIVRITSVHSEPTHLVLSEVQVWSDAEN